MGERCEKTDFAVFLADSCRTGVRICTFCCIEKQSRPVFDRKPCVFRQERIVMGTDLKRPHDAPVLGVQPCAYTFPSWSTTLKGTTPRPGSRGVASDRERVYVSVPGTTLKGHATPRFSGGRARAVPGRDLKSTPTGRRRVTATRLPNERPRKLAAVFVLHPFVPARSSDREEAVRHSFDGRGPAFPRATPVKRLIRGRRWVRRSFDGGDRPVARKKGCSVRGFGLGPRKSIVKCGSRGGARPPVARLGYLRREGAPSRRERTRTALASPGGTVRTRPGRGGSCPDPGGPVPASVSGDRRRGATSLARRLRSSVSGAVRASKRQELMERRRRFPDKKPLRVGTSRPREVEPPARGEVRGAPPPEGSRGPRGPGVSPNRRSERVERRRSRTVVGDRLF